MRKTLTALAAAALAVGVAAPAHAGTGNIMSYQNVNVYFENDNTYSVTMDMRGRVYIDDILNAPEEPKYDGSGDLCPYDAVEKTLVAGEHQYLCYMPLYSDRITRSSGTVQITNIQVTTESGKTFTLDGDVVDNLVMPRANPNAPVMADEGYNILHPQKTTRPDWLSVRREPRSNLTALTYEMHWKAPAEQEVKLQSLMEVDTPDDCTITGTPGDDFLEGTEGDDVICGLGGDDVIDGKGGDDIIKGGSGDDQLSGGDGDDVMGGGPGDDVMDGGAGDDTMHGATGEDVMAGGDGDGDLLDGGSGEDAMDGGDSLVKAVSSQDDGEATGGERQSRTFTSQARQFYRSIVENNAVTDETVNIVEDSDGDGLTADIIGFRNSTLSGMDRGQACYTKDDLDKMDTVDTEFNPDKNRIIVIQTGLPICEQ